LPPGLSEARRFCYRWRKARKWPDKLSEADNMLFRTPIILTVVAGLGLAGCSAPNPFQQNPNQNTNNGLIGGALLGGVAGAVAGNGIKGAAIGAAAGAMLGGAAGSIVDRQSADLKQQLANSGITVTNMGSYLVLNTPADLLFDTGSAALSPNLQRDMTTIASSLNMYPASTIVVVGHTDNTGTAALNMDLSQRRASSVASALIRNGVASTRFTVVGRGEDEPIASNLTPEGRALNRRVEIIIRPTN
jgi:outer membrane protein OmpA-like peptidoglycan-associated protein